MNPNAKDTDGYLKIMKPHECAQDWWDKLKDTDKKIILKWVRNMVESFS